MRAYNEMKSKTRNPSFTLDNTEGYSVADLTELNQIQDRLVDAFIRKTGLVPDAQDLKVISEDAQYAFDNAQRNPAKSKKRNPSGADASIYSPPIGFDSTKGMRGWVSLMRGHVLDSEAGTPERSRRVDEVKRALNYAGFLTRGRSISKVYAETAKQTADWLHTVSDHATRNPAKTEEV